VRGEERAVSDLVGFVLTFALVLASVAIVATVGFDQISEARDQEQIRNSEQGMVELAESFDSVNQRADERRDAGLSLSGGRLQFLDTASLEVTVDPPSGPSTTETIETNAIAHQLDDYEVAYEGGAVFSGSGRLVAYRPTVTCRGNTAIVSVVADDTDDVTVTTTRSGRERVNLVDSDGAAVIDDGIELRNTGSISDEGGILLSAAYDAGDSRVVTRRSYTSGSASVSVDYSDAAYPDGWEQYGDSLGNEWSVSGDTLECTGVNQVLIRQTSVTLSLSSVGDT